MTMVTLNYCTSFCSRCSCFILVFKIHLSLIYTQTLCKLFKYPFIHIFECMWDSINFVSFENSLLEISELLSFGPISSQACCLASVSFHHHFGNFLTSLGLNFLFQNLIDLLHVLTLQEHLLQKLPEKTVHGIHVLTPYISENIFILPSYLIDD